jgi:hypothetical protein
MKKAIKVLFVGLIIGSMTAFYSCSDDDENPDSDLDPNVFCDENLCSTDGDLKDECIDAFNTCMATEPDANDDECAITALAICRP